MAKEEITKDDKVIKIKKDVVKNIAIVFLAVLLVLTFFSNSIMNKSLPEVATMYVESKSIQESIRGTGSVEIDDPYNVEIRETRTISSVAVKTGDIVEKDQVLFYLEDAESAELEEARKTLENLIYKYTSGALTGDMSAGAYNQATTGKVYSMGQYEAQIEAAKQRVKNAEANVDSIARQQTIASGNSKTSSEADLAELKTKLTTAQAALTVAESNYTEAKTVYDANVGAANALTNASTDYATAQSKYNSKLIEVKSKIADADVSQMKINRPGKYDAYTSKDDVINNALAGDIISDAVVLNDWAYASDAPGTKTNQDMVDELIKLYADMNDKATALTVAEANNKAFQEAAANLNSYYYTKVSLKNQVDEIQTQIDKITNDALNSSESNQQLIESLAIKKLDADTELAKAKEDLTQLLTDISKTLDLANQSSEIREQQEKVRKLEEKATGATIKAPVGGTILNVTKVAGEDTKPDEVLATIQVEGKASTLTITVTNDQAKKVTIGDIASLQNAWNYDDIQVRLVRILNDSDNPGKNKKLVFSVTGDVADGQSLSISIGQKAREYEKVVPNSAIREDNKGKFVLIIVEKSTPFGNRYVAKRVDVEVLASDDNNTAVSADLESWAYVITTSDKPLSSGTQVRLADN